MEEVEAWLDNCIPGYDQLEVKPDNMPGFWTAEHVDVLRAWHKAFVTLTREVS